MDKHYLTSEEKELHERGLLDEEKVYERLDEEALEKAIWAVKTPLEKIFSFLFHEMFFEMKWRAEIDDSQLVNQRATSCSSRVLGLLKQIENRLDLNAFAVENYIGIRQRISAVTQTRDGRTLKLHFYYR